MAKTPPPAIVTYIAGAFAAAGLAVGAYEIFKGVTAKTGAVVLPNNNYIKNNLTQFPYDLPSIPSVTSPDGQMYCILFSFYQYNRPSVQVPPTLVPYGSIALAMPADLIDATSQDYSEQGSSLAVGAALENFSLSGTDPTMTQVGEALMSSALAGGKGYAMDGVNNAVNAVSPNLLNKSLAFAGVVQNPFLSVLFNAPKFKRHVFSWTLIPETAQDVENLNYIINKFRYHQMPDINNSSGAGLLLTYPDMCVPMIFPRGYMYDFKQCVIEGMSTNYAPGNSPSFNTKGGPSAVKLTISLLEIEYWIKSDLLNASSDFGTNLSQYAQYGQAPYGSSQ